MNKRIISIVILVILTGGLTVNELIKRMTGSIMSPRKVESIYTDNKENIDFITSYIASFELEDEHFYITPEAIELCNSHGKAKQGGG